MPSAVLMGMGLTPQLASAKPLPKNPFKGGACVSQPDKDENQDKAAKERLEKAKEKAEKEREKQREEAGKDGSDSKPGSGSDSSKPDPSPSPSGDSGGSGGSGDPSPSPSPSDPDEDDGDDDGGLLGGIGDAIGDVLTPKEKKEKAAEEKKKEEEKASSDSGSGSSGSSASKSDKPVEDAVGKVGDGLKDTTDKLGKGVEDVGKGAKDKLPSAGGDDEAGKDTARKDGKDFPCVEEKKSAGKDEQTPNTLPNEAWRLEASSLGLHGLDYEGVVNIRTQDGKTKQALKFTASSLDIGDLHQIVTGPDGTNYHVRAAQGSTSTVKGGKVTMYTEELKGNLFGLIPITFDPEHPPPLNIPEAYFTNVKVKQAGQFGGNLTVPGMHQTID
ncbi:hypothetical protein [Streptomyces sp. HNM0575]|uniref:hypothetical protein n=1 Tax=Streptomyces sp. HNM0575 TaxID=2716338 RepID=UPI001F0FE5A7|nr:hypothetical protein [Streptomyces sp. HNM0575]